MAKLLLNDDGSVTMPLTPDADGKPRTVLLPEPSMRMLAKLHALAAEADEKLPAFNQLPSEPEPEDMARVADQLRARSVSIFGEDSPHGHAMIEFIAELMGTRYTEDDLYGWAMAPRTMQQILQHFQAPLPGPDSVQTTP